MGGWQRYQNKEMNNDILIAYGYGDGGGGRACGFRTERGGGRRGETRETPQSPGQRERKAQNRT